MHADLRPNNLDPLRALLALWLFLAFALALHGLDPLATATNGQLTSWELPFFALTAIAGFLAAASLQHHSPATFLLRRTLRIVPAFFAASLLISLIASPLLRHASLTRAEILDTLWRSLVLQPGQSPPTDTPDRGDLLILLAKSPLWIVGYVFRCYLLLTLLALARLFKPGPRATVTAALLFAASLALSLFYSPNLDHAPWPAWLEAIILPAKSWPNTLAYFFAGVLFFHLRHPLRPRPILFGACLILLIAIAPFFGAALFFPTAGVYVLFYFARLRLPKDLSPWIRPFTYGLYLYAAPAICLASLGNWNLPLTLAAALPALLLLAAASYFAFQRPLEKAAHRRL